MDGKIDSKKSMLSALLDKDFPWILLDWIIQFSMSSQFNSIWPIDRTLSGATIPSQSGPGSNGNIMSSLQQSIIRNYVLRRYREISSLLPAYFHGEFVIFWFGLVSCHINHCGVVVILVGNEHGDTSSNPGRDWLHFT